MRKWIVSLVVVVVMASSAAFAAGKVIGTPGEANCEGQTLAYVLDVYQDVLGIHGIGNIAKFLGISVKDIHAAVDAYCNP